MITHETIELAERDPAIAALSIMMSVDRMAAWLSDPTLPIDDQQRTIRPQPDYLRYKPGTSLIVGYHTDDGPLFGYAVSREAAPKFTKQLRDAPPGSIIAYDRELRMILARPTADRDLPGVRTVAGTAATALAYKPQRRFVGALDDRILRCYRRSDLAALLSRWPGEAHVAGVRTPTVLGSHRRSGSATVERLPGVRLDRLTGQDRISGLQSAGTALARWHHRAPTPSRPAELPVSEAVADQLAQILPGEASRIARLAGRVATLCAEVDHGETDLGWCHGDFSIDQVLVDETGGISLLDWDRSGGGPSAADLASADAAGSGPTIGLSAADWQALTDGYQGVRPLPNRLHQRRTIARFVRAVDPFRSAHPDWPLLVRANLDRVEELL